MKLLLLFFFLASNAFAQITFVHVKGKHAFTFEETKELVKEVEERFKSFGMPLGKIKIRSVRNPFKHLHKLSSTNLLAFSWRGWLEEKTKGAAIAIIPPIEGYIAGYSFKNAGYVAVQPWNEFGDDRREHSIIAIMHEIGHLKFNLKHADSEPNIMMSAPLPFVDTYELGFLSR